MEKRVSIARPFFATIIVSIVTFAMYFAARDIEAGKEIVVSGRRSGLKRLIVMLGDTLGTTGSLVVGGIAILLCLLWLVKSFKARQAATPAPSA